MMECNLKDVLAQFDVYSDVAPYGDGHINDTYRVKGQPYILQRINTNVLKNPYEVMENIDLVTQYLREKIIAAGGDPDRETITIIKTKDGKNFYEADKDHVYRMFKFIEGAKTYSKVESPQQLYNAAKAFGRFQTMLSDFPAEKLHETIPQFHYTPNRVQQLRDAIENDAAGRAASVQKEIEFALFRAAEADTIVKAMEDGSVPLRVTHNDTKLNNVMLDEKTGEGVCVIDLDTVMPGSMLYDYGDALRFGASTADEDETDLSKVWFDVNMFKYFSMGYLEEMKDVITEKEIELMPFSAKLLTYECGIRFLADYLNGDTYFKIHREHHNLDRARTQFKLVEDIENKTEELKSIITEMTK